MKKLIVLIAAFLFTGTVIAQDYNKTQTTTTQSTTTQTQEKKSDKAIEMKAGKVYDVRDGKSTMITSNVTVGTSTVMPDGTVKMKDGTTTVLKEGDCVYADGTVKKSTVKDPNDKMEK